MTHLDEQRIIADAIEDARDGQLGAQRLASVRELLSTSPTARRYYLTANELASVLTSARTLPHATRSTTRVRAAHRVPRKRWMPAMVIGLAAATAAGIVLAALLFGLRSDDRTPPDDRRRVIALLEQINGSVRVTTADAATRANESRVEIASGDTIRTQGALSSAVLSFPDGTRLSLVGETSLTPSADVQKSVVFHGGTMFGSVVAQPSGRPLLVVTPQDKVQVLGTRFSLDATAAKTDVCVSEGRVRLTRIEDGRSVEVPAGRRVVSRVASDLVVEAIPEAPDEWSEDFEQGLPADWQIGTFVAANLPPGSHGAVGTARDAATGAREAVAIAGGVQWSHGLFAVHDDTHLHITLKMQDPGWFNILILTRTADDDPPRFAGNYIFGEPVWFRQPGEWGTLSIPLSKFRPLPPSRESFENAIPFQVLLSCPERDRGLVVDRLWVTRGSDE